MQHSDTCRWIHWVDSWATGRKRVAGFESVASADASAGFVLHTKQAGALLGVHSRTNPSVAQTRGHSGLERWQAGPHGPTHPRLRESCWTNKGHRNRWSVSRQTKTVLMKVTHSIQIMWKTKVWSMKTKKKANTIHDSVACRTSLSSDKLLQNQSKTKRQAVNLLQKTKISQCWEKSAQQTTELNQILYSVCCIETPCECNMLILCKFMLKKNNCKYLYLH